MNAFFNEIDPFAARWLRNLMFAGHLPRGVVEERSIEDLSADELPRGQCHFFAGIGVWAHAARLAGWPEDFDLWSGSCPCQPFSAAGLGKGFDDERHLWPAWFELIQQRRPRVIVGEQVASPDGLAWLDAVHADLEGEGYAVAAFDLCAAGFGAPHIRQRLYFAAVRVADYDYDETRRQLVGATRLHEDGPQRNDVDRCGSAVGLGHANGQQPGRDTGEAARKEGEPGLRAGGEQSCASGAAGSGLADTESDRRQGRPGGGTRDAGGDAARLTPGGLSPSDAWAAVEWLDCRDGVRRPTQPGLRPLVDGAAGRVGQLRAYGNAVVGPQATAFLRLVRDCLTGPSLSREG